MHHGTLVAVVLLLGDDIPAEQFAERADDDRCRSVFRSTPANGKPSGEAIDVLTGFITDIGDAMGRPVGVAIDRRGALLVADDVGNTVWRVTATGKLASGK